ncbi:MAG TPA: cupin domain-containing protein [Anaeromyxobacteraceae bacterium]|nr:cupin domain-containing protein [Anaeromyxobacteraceae bacterium]
MHPEALEIVERLSLAPHPEGGFYRETWRSTLAVATPRGERAALTLVHYLLPAGSFSAFHRIPGDEVWQHAAGDDLELLTIAPSGHRRRGRLGPAARGDAEPHRVVPAGAWQAARVLGDRYALVSCAVAPGFDFRDLEFLGADALAGLWPEALDLAAGRPGGRP